MNLENSGTDSCTLLGIPSLPWARGTTDVGTGANWTEEQKRREKYYSMFFFAGLSDHLFPYIPESAEEKNYSGLLQNT